MPLTYLGDFPSTAVSVQHKFMTVNASGKPTTLGDSPSMVLYVNATTTGIVSGVSVSTDFDGRTGLNHVRFLVTTSVTGITSGTECALVVATGSVSGVSLNGYPVCQFSVMNRPVQTVSTVVNANVTAISTIAPARVTAQGIDIGAIVTAVNTIVPARVTAQGIDVGAIVTAVNTIVPARITAQGIDIGAIVTAVSTIVPARITAQGINIGAIVTTMNTVANANVTSISTLVPANVTTYSTAIPATVTAISTQVPALVTSYSTAIPALVTAFSASGLAQLFVVDSGTTFASAVAGSPVKEIADNAGGSSLTTTGIAAGVWGAEVTTFATASSFGKQLGGSTVLPANVTAASIDVGAIVTAVNTIVPARITAQGIDIGAIVTAFNTIANANVTSISTVVNANVTAISTQVPALITATSTIVPARITAQGIDVGAIVTAVNTIVPARITAQGIDVGAIVTAFNTIANANVTAYSTQIAANVTAASTAVNARVTSISASGLASMFLTDSGTTYASSVAGSPVKEIADNAGGTSLSVTGIAAGVWGSEVTVHTTAGTFGKQLGGSTVLPANVTAASIDIGAIVTASNTVVVAHVTSLATGIISWPTFDPSTLVNGRLDTNTGTIASVTVIGSGSAAALWRGA